MCGDATPRWAWTVHNPYKMDASSAKVRILLIRPWTKPLAPLRAALHEAGITARISRVDIEPALNAALGRDDIDIILFDPTTTGVTREVLDARLLQHRRVIPIVTLNAVDDLARAIQDAFASIASQLN
jgi:hypothetical protein